jgi:hypothetical protein
VCITKTYILVVEICYFHLILRKEFCSICISQFLLPSLIATTTTHAMALQGVFQKLQIFKNVSSGPKEGKEGGGGGRGFELQTSKQFRGDNMVIRHDH